MHATVHIIYTYVCYAYMRFQKAHLCHGVCLCTICALNLPMTMLE